MTSREGFQESRDYKSKSPAKTWSEVQVQVEG